MSWKSVGISFYSQLLDSCISSKNLIALRQSHAQTIINGMHHNPFIRSKLASAYASCGQMREATVLFSFCSRRYTFLYNSIIRGYASMGRFSSSLSFFRRMLDDNKFIDNRTLPSVMKSCARLPAPNLGKQVHAMVLVKGYSSDLANANSIIDAYGKYGDLKSAQKLFDEMPVRNEVSWTARMVALGVQGRFSEVLEVFRRMVEVKVKMDAWCFTVVLNACSHGGIVEEGIEVFRKMGLVFGVKPNVKHYTCMVDMLGRAGRIEEAKEIVMDMDVKPDEALWSALLGACKIHGDMDLARRIVLNAFETF